MEITKYAILYGDGYVEFSSEEARAQFVVDKQITSYEFLSVIEEVSSNENITAKVETAIKEAQAFGARLAMDFLVENTILGITQLGMIEKVREALDMTFRAVETGSLREAISRIKAIPPEQKYPIFITDERMLKYVNSMETFLGIPLSTSI